MIRTIAYLDQLFQPVKTCLSVLLPSCRGSPAFTYKGLLFSNLVPSLLVGCLQLQRVLRGIKRHQGSDERHRQPITIELMHIIFQSLNLSDYNHKKLWASRCLMFFGFLRAGEFSINLHFNPDIHIAVSDVQAESLVNTGSFRIYIKCSKTDPFHQGCYIYIGAAPCMPLPSIFMSVAQLLAYFSFSLVAPL